MKILLSLVLGLNMVHGAWAQAEEPWPTRPLSVVVPGAPGGTVDNPTRLLAKRLGEAIGQAVVVVNKPGAAGILGTQAALAAPADGYTLLAGNIGPQAINYSAYASLPYRPADLRAIGGLIAFPNVLVVRSDSGIASVPQLLAHLKSDPRSAFGSAGLGQTTHLMGEMFKRATGVSALHVPYKGSSPATMGLLAGETTFMFDNLTQALPHIRSGKLRALAVTASRRAHELPDVPTVSEVGFDGLTASVWIGVFVSASTPQRVAERIEDAVSKSMADIRLRAQLVAMGGVPMDLYGKAFQDFVAAERHKWGRAVLSSGIKAE